MARKMKYSGIEWIGRIPSHWGICNFGNVSDIYGRIGFRGYTTEDMVDKGEGPITLSPSNIVDQKLNLSKCSYISWHKYEESPEIKVFKNDIILVKTASVGKCAIYNSDEAATLNPQLVVLKNIVCDYMFLYYLIISDVIQTPIVLDNFGSVIPTITQENINHYKIPLPPIEEQQAISVFLSNQCAEIDSVIAKTRTTIEEYKKLKQSIITEAVTKGIRFNRAMKNSGIGWIGEIPDNFVKYRIKNIAEVFGRIGFRGYTVDDLVVEGNGAITLSPSNIKDMKMNYSKLSYLTWEKYEESPEIKISKGNILMVKTGSSYGKSAIVDELPLDATINPQLVVIKNISINEKYLLYCFQTPYFLDQIENAVVGGTIPTMSQEKINNFYIFAPGVDEQYEIVEHLNKKCGEIDVLIVQKNALLEELESYKKSLIYEYVTGKKEVL